jgi:8-oxo-dGTP diphosphatase
MNGARAELVALKTRAAAQTLGNDNAGPSGAIFGAALDGTVSTPKLDLLVQRPRVGVGCVLLSALHAGKLLIGERKGSHGAGKWALPGGHLEQGQSFEQCARMEVKEECDIDVEESSWSLLWVSNDPMPSEDLHYVTIFQVARITEEQTSAIRNMEEDKCLGWQWVPYSELKSLQVFTPLQNFIERGGLDKLQKEQ